MYLKIKTPLLRDVDIDELMAGLTEEELLALDAELERDVIQETSHNTLSIKSAVLALIYSHPQGLSLLRESVPMRFSSQLLLTNLERAENSLLYVKRRINFSLSGIYVV